MKQERTYDVNIELPDNGQRVLCWGHKTCCCVEDMEPEADWHEVVFRFQVCSYGLKKTIPLDLEESILEKYEVEEVWDASKPKDQPEHIIGVTKWKRKEGE